MSWGGGSFGLQCYQPSCTLFQVTTEANILGGFSQPSHMAWLLQLMLRQSDDLKSFPTVAVLYIALVVFPTKLPFTST